MLRSKLPQHAGQRALVNVPKQRFSTENIVVDNPYTGKIFCEIEQVEEKRAHEMVISSAKVQQEWKYVDLAERQRLVEGWMSELRAQEDNIAYDITGQMGKPLQQARNEINGTLQRAEVLLELSNSALATDTFADEDGTFRQIVKEPIGPVLVIAPWNYPLMTAVNAIVPAILAGNSVIIKHSPRTPLCADHYVNTFSSAGAPSGLVQALNCANETTASVIQNDEIGFVSFTGSVEGGRAINQIASKRFIDTTLELGGKDAAYVAADADIESAAMGLVDGACYNAGQSCCGIERVYVHESKYNEFLEAANVHMMAYKLGDPMEGTTTMGPLALQTAQDFLEFQVTDALSKGAKVLSGTGRTVDSAKKGRFFTPTLLANCDHSMLVMSEESFGPIMAVTSVRSDEDALDKMNQSDFGLTGAIFTSDKYRALRMGEQLRTGTVFMNRCDALDPYLPWTGVRNTGKGASLSKYGFHSFIKMKSYNFKL